MKIRVNLDIRSYDCIIERGILSNLKTYLDLNKKVLIVIDDNVDIKYLGDINDKNIFITKFHATEHNKSLESYQEIMKILLENNFSRKDTLVSVGGGITGDLCGFVSATYKRGCKFINCPTTTLSCIDSSVGGKVAVNFGDIKNSIGAFYQPSLVLIDPNVLETLPIRQYNNGLIEALKMGLIGDESLYNIFKKELSYKDHIETIIIKSLDLKRKIVEEDETETGNRKLLNFGHTIGHAIESLNLDSIYHGEAVGLGMLYMIEDDALRCEVKEILMKLNAYHSFENTTEDLIKKIMNDKKADNSSIDVVKVDKVASSRIKKVSFDELTSIINRG